MFEIQTLLLTPVCRNEDGALLSSFGKKVDP
jgi:hypothetical protein